MLYRKAVAATQYYTRLLHGRALLDIPLLLSRILVEYPVKHTVYLVLGHPPPPGAGTRVAREHFLVP